MIIHLPNSRGNLEYIFHFTMGEARIIIHVCASLLGLADELIEWRGSSV